MSTDQFADSSQRFGKKSPFETRNRVVLSIGLPASVAVSAGTISGDGQVSGMDSPTRLASVSGSVTADATAGSLNASTVSGEAIIGNHDEGLALNSVSGNMMIRLPENVAAALTVTSAAGKMTVNDERISVRGVSTRSFGDPGSPVVAIRTVSNSGATSIVNRRGSGSDGGTGLGGLAADGGTGVGE